VDPWDTLLTMGAEATGCSVIGTTTVAIKTAMQTMAMTRRFFVTR
jgi:hypothetical protein